MRFNIGWLKQYLKTDCSVQQLTERCTATGLEVEGIYQGESLAKLLASEGATADVVAALKGDALVEVNVTANRPDLAGLYGIARDLAAADMGQFQTVSPKAISEVNSKSLNISVSSALPKDATHHCSQFVGRLISGVNNTGQSPVEVRARLAAVSARVINPLVDITNYFCFGFCRPLHVFDADTLVGQVVVRHSKAAEKFVGLDGKTYELPAALTVIADDAGVLAVAGVLGGERSSCTAKTKNVFLEVAYFDPVQTAKAGRLLGIISAARYRFERGVDPAFLEIAEKLATNMILQTCGGQPSAVCGYGAGFERASFEYRPSDVEKIIGINVEESKQREMLKALGFEINGSGKSFTVKPPSWRVDVTQARDVVEEIARLVGFDAVPMTQLYAPRALSSRAPLTVLQARQFAAQNSAAQLGYHGSVSWSFMQDSHAALFGELHDGLHIKNPIASDLNYLRPTALGNLILAAKANHSRSVDSLALSETGPAFSFANGAVVQELRVVALRSGNSGARSWHEKVKIVDAFDAKGDLFSLLPDLGIQINRCEVVAGKAAHYFHPGLSAAVMLDGVLIAQFGIVHPQVRSVMGLDEPCVAFEIFLERLPETRINKSDFVRNDSQIVDRDFAVLVPSTVSAHDIESAAEKAIKGSKIQLENYSISFFDRYVGKGIEPGKKSIAFTVRMQPPTGQTLESASIEAVSAAVIAGLRGELGAELR